jgi:hypothetical protein
MTTLLWMTPDLSPREVRGTADPSTARRDRSASLPRNFLRNLLALTDLMRLSLREKRTRDLVQCGVAGNPGRDDKGKGDDSMESGCWTDGAFHDLGWAAGP